MTKCDPEVVERYHKGEIGDDFLLTMAEVAAIRRCSTDTLALERAKGIGPRYVKLGPRRLLCSVGELRRDIAARMIGGAHQQDSGSAKNSPASEPAPLETDKPEKADPYGVAKLPERPMRRQPRLL